MRRQAPFIAALAILAILSTLAYVRWVNPEVNAPLGLDHFDESLVRARVTATAQHLLDSAGRFDLRLSQQVDTPKIQRMQQLFGIRATSYWTRKDVPIQRWIYRAYPPQKLTDLRLFKDREQEAPLTVEVDSSGQILALTIPPKKNAPGNQLSADQARAVAEDALRFAGVDVGRLTLTATMKGDAEGQQTFDFTWKQPVSNLPGLVYQFSVKLQSGYLTSFKRDILFAEEAPPSLAQDLVMPLLTGAAWFFLSLVFLALFVQRLRRDELDFRRAQKVGLLAGGLAFLKTVSEPSGSVLQTLLGAALFSVLAALFFGVLWAVTESLLREAFSDKLKAMDLLFDGHLRVRETARSALWSTAWAATFLSVPVILLAAATQWRDLNVVLLPTSMELGNLRFPGGLVGDALLGPLPYVTVVGCLFLGVVYPLLRVRFSSGRSAAVFCVLFAMATAHLLPVGPPLLALVLALLFGGALFAVMEQAGLLGGLVLLYVPQTLRSVALLQTARYPSVSFQAWLSVGILATLLAAAAYVAILGRPQAGLEDYEPDYLARIRERERFARELEVAKGIQERFLPKENPVISGFSVATRCVPAMEVGGDYYDFLPLPDGRWLLLLGDVSGKGVRAAFYMTLTKGILHAIAAAEDDQVQILRRLNGIFGKLGESGIFLTLCALVLDPATRNVQILSAGHNPPFLVRPGSVGTLEPRGLVLGVMGDDFFVKSMKVVDLTLEPGDALVLYTDGVTEAMDRRDQEFGMERLQETLESARLAGARGIVEAILNSVARFQRGARQTDDLTLLVLEAHEA
jgi:phosphoserine phosphatase RsbU/P